MKRRLKINGFIIFIAVLLAATFPAIFFRYNSTGCFDEALERLASAAGIPPDRIREARRIARMYGGV